MRTNHCACKYLLFVVVVVDNFADDLKNTKSTFLNVTHTHTNRETTWLFKLFVQKKNKCKQC